MNPRQSWVVYSIIRIGMFVVIFLVLWLIGLAWYFAAIAAALCSLALSLVFLRRPREEAAASLYNARHRDKTVRSAPTAGVDEDIEDAAVDEATGAADEPAEAPADEPGSERDR